MKFGKVLDPSLVDFSLQEDQTSNVFSSKLKGEMPKIHVGCAKWNKQDLKGFYPKGIKDELSYYSQQFNSIELNATFYRIFPKEVVQKWKSKTPENFKFFPKLPNRISQYKRLKDVKEEVNLFLDSILHLEEKLGMLFLQMPPNFTPKNKEDLEKFVIEWHPKIPLAIELRHAEWYNNEAEFKWFTSLLEEHYLTHIITDTAGRRDLVHMHLSTPKTFIRFTGANHESDYTRLDAWNKRIHSWINQGMEEINFFVHQNLEVESPLLSSYFIKQFNELNSQDLKLPILAKDANTLF